MPSTATRLRRVTTIADMRAELERVRGEAARIGFVPTMGALHRGHLSLVDRARQEAQVVVMSIFVNPLQFGPAEDFKRYPRPLEQDSRLAADAGVDILFTPSAAEMYPEGHVTTVSAGQRGEVWEGKVRPGHFDGVLTVVAKLFNIVQPDFAVFGRKDLQQASLVRTMVRDLDFPLEIVVAPTIREGDGLALSSRNGYLSRQERNDALVLIRSLRAVSAAFSRGERNVRRLQEIGREQFAAVPAVTLDYFAVVNPGTLEEELIAGPGSAAIVAARVGSTRLIDNIILGKNDQD
jgi:pantoate--beta-alanine ligase